MGQGIIQTFESVRLIALVRSVHHEIISLVRSVHHGII